MRVLVTGAGGQVGRELVDLLPSRGHEPLGYDHQALDVGDRDSVLATVAEIQPDVIVHAGAWTNVDGCEGDPDRAWRVNAMGTQHVAEAARRFGSRLCYLSTDYVFDGRSGTPYVEWDVPNPLSVYGRSKLGGERGVGPDDVIVRTSWVCGRHGRNFVRTIVEQAAAGEELTVVDDQHGCPTFADDLAGAICMLLERRLPGVFHVTNQGPTTWFQFARDALALAGIDPARIKPIRTADMDPPRPAPRPAFAVLDNAALRAAGLPLLPDHHEPLKRLVEFIQHPEAA